MIALPLHEDLIRTAQGLVDTLGGISREVLDLRRLVDGLEMQAEEATRFRNHLDEIERKVVLLQRASRGYLRPGH